MMTKEYILNFSEEGKQLASEKCNGEEIEFFEKYTKEFLVNLLNMEEK